MKENIGCQTEKYTTLSFNVSLCFPTFPIFPHSSLLIGPSLSHTFPLLIDIANFLLFVFLCMFNNAMLINYDI